MDKGTFENYEFLPPNNAEADQFYIVQDDGTFLINRQVQYVTQVQDKVALEEAQQPCSVTVYDVSSQQFFVDVDNSPELISVPDQFILPDGESNLYANSYLIQPSSSTSNEPMQVEVPEDQLKDPIAQQNLNAAAQTNKLANCAEITLNEDQYHMLEEKGWILLEINDKIYVLDAFGLHDITTNDKLIKKLRNEDENQTQGIDNGSMKIENENVSAMASILQNTSSQEDQNIAAENEVINEVEDLPLTIKENPEVNSQLENKQECTERPGVINSSECQNTKNNDSEEIEEHDNCTRVLVIENEDIRREGSVLKVKTQLSLKGFPDKIVLGKTPSGKKLVAKVVKSNIEAERKSTDIDQDKPEEPLTISIGKRKWVVEKNTPAININSSCLLNESEFLMLIKHLIQHNLSKCSADDIVAADSVIAQLLQIPAFKTTVMDSNLVVTKTIQNEATPKENKGLSAIVTGRVTPVDGQWRFIHLPYMLQKMVKETEYLMKKNHNGESNVNKTSFDVLHVQISEVKPTGTNMVRVSVTVNKRYIPMDLICDIQKQQPSTMYACSACAAVFKTEKLLKDHQTNHCLEPDDMLTIDMEPQTDTSYCVINSGKTKTYTCLQCNAKFNRLNACKNHLKTHSSSTTTNDVDEKQNVKSSGVHKCNMCPCTYFHPSTLSKHILSRHIKMKS